MTTYEIEISIDTAEAAEFAAFLNEKGHVAHVGTSTGSYVDGSPTSDAEASEIMNNLWEAYCNA